ncbi:ATP-binding cassette domain-containing protein [Paenibacillaceae bacterium]|nr:ATP-binding cassette domain-containing protein [Paenibacillaceae bacterium]
MNKIIEVTGLKKSFGSVQAVKKVDFCVMQGAMFAFLGPNGAGKSTTIDMVTTQLRPDAGEVLVNGFRLGQEDERIRASIGIVSQDSLLDPLLTVEENLYVRGGFYKLSKAALKTAIAQASATADVNDFLKRPYGKLSGGQRRRADIARALINTPRILFLDEPTTGLDPQTRKNVWQTIRQLQQQQGMTIFLTTHYMEEAAQADFITIMDHGEVLAQGTPLTLKDRHAQDTLKLLPKDSGALAVMLDSLQVPYTVASEVFQIPLQQTTAALPIIDRARDNIANIEIINGTMDDVFLNLTGTEVRG